MRDESSRPASITLQEFRERLGRPGWTSDWVTVAQSQINMFADATDDHTFIHVDPARPAATRFGGTIAHGLLTLSLLPHFLYSAVPHVTEMTMGVNYGFDRVRFISPVPVGKRLRARFDLVEMREDKPKFYLVTFDVTVELEGATKPGCRRPVDSGAMAGVTVVAERIQIRCISQLTK